MFRICSKMKAMPERTPVVLVVSVTVLRSLVPACAEFSVSCSLPRACRVSQTASSNPQIAAGEARFRDLALSGTVLMFYFLNEPILRQLNNRIIQIPR